MCRISTQRKGAERALEILTANKKAVSNEGMVKIPARKTKDTTLVRHGLLRNLVASCGRYFAKQCLLSCPRPEDTNGASRK